MPSSETLLGLLFALGLLATARGASAEARLSDERGLDVRLYRPPVDANGYLSVNGTGMVRRAHANFGVLLDLGWQVGPGLPEPWVDFATTALGTLSVGVTDSASLGVSFPVQSLTGPAVRVPGVYNDSASDLPAPLRSAGIGDLELHGKLRMPTGASPWSVSTIVKVSLPTGDAVELRGEPGATLWPSVTLEYSPLAFVRAAAEAGYRLVHGVGARLPGDASVLEYDDQLSFGAAVELSPSSRLSLLLDGYGTRILRAFGEAFGTSFELAAGVRIHLSEHLAIFAAGAGSPVRGVRGARARAIFGLNVGGASADLDEDGYPARADACPNTAEDFNGFEDSDGCPDLDNDGDGIEDRFTNVSRSRKIWTGRMTTTAVRRKAFQTATPMVSTTTWIRSMIE